MYKKLQILILGILGCLAFQAYSIKLTNNTQDTLLYCCGNPADKNTFVQKYELGPKQTVEIIEQENYLQIYSKQKPTVLRGKYPLSNQGQDLTIITTPPLGMYKFVPTKELNDQAKKINPKIGVPAFGIPAATTKMEAFNRHLAEKQANLANAQKETKERLAHPTKERPKNNGRRQPSRKHLKQKSKMNETYEEIDEISHPVCSDVQDTSIEAENPIQTTSGENITEPSIQLTDSNIFREKIIDSNATISSETKIQENNKQPEDAKVPVTIKPAQAIARAKAKELATRSKSSYLTKKNIGTFLGLGVAGTACLVAWWYTKLSIPLV